MRNIPIPIGSQPSRPPGLLLPGLPTSGVTISRLPRVFPPSLCELNESASACASSVLLPLIWLKTSTWVWEWAEGK